MQRAPFFSFTPEANFKHDRHLGIQHQSQQPWSHEIWEKCTWVPSLLCLLESSLLPFGRWSWKLYTKQGCGLTLSPFVLWLHLWLPVLQTALPSPRLKLDQLLVAAVGFAWVIIVFETELQTFNKACLSLWLCTRNRLFHGSQNGKWNHCPRYQIYFGLFFSWMQSEQVKLMLLLWPHVQSC